MLPWSSQAQLANLRNVLISCMFVFVVWNVFLEYLYFYFCTFLGTLDYRSNRRCILSLLESKGELNHCLLPNFLNLNYYITVKDITVQLKT